MAQISGRLLSKLLNGNTAFNEEKRQSCAFVLVPFHFVSVGFYRYPLFTDVHKCFPFFLWFLFLKIHFFEDISMNELICGNV